MHCVSRTTPFRSRFLIAHLFLRNQPFKCDVIDITVFIFEIKINYGTSKKKVTNLLFIADLSTSLSLFTTVPLKALQEVFTFSQRNILRNWEAIPLSFEISCAELQFNYLCFFFPYLHKKYYPTFHILQLFVLGAINFSGNLNKQKKTFRFERHQTDIFILIYFHVCHLNKNFLRKLRKVVKPRWLFFLIC